MIAPETNPYNREFFEGFAPRVGLSAEVVVPIIMGLLRPRAVVDVGCGTGIWLAAFAECGAQTVVGVDGAYAKDAGLRIPEESFVARDLRKPLDVGRSFDVAVSLEVAEHLPPECAEGFVSELVSLAPAVLFSAAIPWQGGTSHVNERWQSFWAKLFAGHGYELVDCIRPRVWDNPSVYFWYAQNTFLYIDPTRVALPAEIAASRLPLDVVHPRLLEVWVGRAQLEDPRLVRYASRVNDTLYRLRQRFRPPHGRSATDS